VVRRLTMACPIFRAPPNQGRTARRSGAAAPTGRERCERYLGRRGAVRRHQEPTAGGRSARSPSLAPKLQRRRPASARPAFAGKNKARPTGLALGRAYRIEPGRGIVEDRKLFYARRNSSPALASSFRARFKPPNYRTASGAAARRRSAGASAAQDLLAAAWPVEPPSTASRSDADPPTAPAACACASTAT